MRPSTTTDRLTRLFADVGEACADAAVLDDGVAKLATRVDPATMQKVFCVGGADRWGLCRECGKSLAKGGHDPGGCLVVVPWHAARLVRRVALRARYHLRRWLP